MNTSINGDPVSRVKHTRRFLSPLSVSSRCRSRFLLLCARVCACACVCVAILDSRAWSTAASRFPRPGPRKVALFALPVFSARTHTHTTVTTYDRLMRLSARISVSPSPSLRSLLLPSLFSLLPSVSSTANANYVKGRTRMFLVTRLPLPYAVIGI